MAHLVHLVVHGDGHAAETAGNRWGSWGGELDLKAAKKGGDLACDGGGNTQGEGRVFATKAVGTHTAKAVSLAAKAVGTHTRQRQSLRHKGSGTHKAEVVS